MVRQLLTDARALSTVEMKYVGCVQRDAIQRCDRRDCTHGSEPFVVKDFAHRVAAALQFRALSCRQLLLQGEKGERIQVIGRCKADHFSEFTGHLHVQNPSVLWALNRFEAGYPNSQA